MKKGYVLLVILILASVQIVAAERGPVQGPVYSAPTGGMAKSVPEMLEGVLADTVVFFDFESGDQGFQGIDGSAQEAYWHADAFNAYGGSGKSYWCARVGVDKYDGYDNIWYQWMDTPTIDLREAVPPISLRFKHFVDFEPEDSTTSTGWDAANVRLSEDDGQTFDVLDPEFPDYDADSCAAFHLFQEAPIGGYPGWGGLGGPWKDVEFDLSDYVGSEVIVRFVFASDWSWSTINTYNCPSSYDTTWYAPHPGASGYFVDEITVEDASGNLFTDNAGDAGSAQMVAGSRDVGDYGFALTTENAHSPTHSWNFDADETYIGGISVEQTEAYLYWLESPWIELPAGEYPELSYYVFCDLPDHDGNDDGTLEDYYQVYVQAEDGSWEKLFHDYNRDYTQWDEEGNYFNQTGFMFWDNTIIYNGTAKLDRWAGQQVKIAWDPGADDDNDGGNGTGIWIDDVTITSRAAPDRDVGIEFVAVKFPMSVELDIPVKGLIRNYGMLDQPSIIVWYFIEDRDGNKVGIDRPAGPPWPSLPSLQTKPFDFTYTPTDTGAYRVCFYQFIPDQYTPNDSGYSSYFWVWPENEGYMAHHYYLYESGHSGGAGEGPAMRFDPPADIGPYNIETLEIDVSGTGDCKFLVYKATGTSDVIPDDGELLHESEVLSVPVHSGSDWRGWNVSEVEALQCQSGSFFVYVQMQEGNDLGYSGATSPFPPTNSFYYNADSLKWFHDDEDYRMRCYLRWGISCGGTCQGLRGDPTGDGSTNVLDVLSDVNHILGVVPLTGDALCRGDCTGDGQINVLDALNIVNVILGIIPKCPGTGECKTVVTPETMEFMESLESYLSPEDFDQIMTLVKGEVTMPTEFGLAQNYPNPFNPTTTINYQIPMTKSQPHVTLKIFNVLGQEVATLVDEVREAGTYTARWDASAMASGIYFYRLQAGSYTATRQMVLMK